MDHGPVCVIGTFLAFLSLVLAGSPCPPRSAIYPCRCESVPQRKTAFTWVACNRLQSTASLDPVLHALKTMNIDKLGIYDSFWEAHKLGMESKQVLPTDWVTLRVKELEIIDTRLSPSFACNVETKRCKNSVITRFSIVNSSSSESISTLCSTKSEQKISWTSCMSNLQSFSLQQGRLKAVKNSLFPILQQKLREVDLSHNAIMKVESEAFKKTPELRILNLSHNRLKELLFLSKRPSSKLEKLDISHNLIKTLGSELFPNMPSLKTFKISNNEIVILNETEWKLNPGTLKMVDITDNPIHCDCTVRWINTTYPAREFQGKCKTPDRFKNSYIRKISSTLAQQLPKNITCEEWMKQHV